MVALSVSTSAMISPDFTTSPTFFNQAEIVPSCMVSLILGMVTTTAGIEEVLTAAGRITSATAGAGAGIAASTLVTSETDPDNRCWNASPFSPIIAMIPFTGTESFSFMPTYSKTPSSYDSSSIVALSVSTSARISPGFTVSPTFFNQDAITPSSMVSLIFGILIISAMF